MAPSAAQETVSLPSGGLLTLPPTRPGARHFSGLPSTRPSFNTHSSRSGSVQRILSAVPAPALSHSADFLWGRAPPIECSSISVAMWTLPPVVADIKQIHRSAVNGQNLSSPFRAGREGELGVRGFLVLWGFASAI